MCECGAVGPPIGGEAFTAIVECVEASMWNMTNFTDPCMVCMMGCATPQPDMTCMAQCTAGPCHDMFPEAEPSGGCGDGLVLCPAGTANAGSCKEFMAECGDMAPQAEPVWGMFPEGEPRNGSMINGSMTYDDLVEMCPDEMAACANAGPSDLRLEERHSRPSSSASKLPCGT